MFIDWQISWVKSMRDDVEAYIKQLEETNAKLRNLLEQRNCPSYAKVLQVNHSVASYYNNRMDDVESTIMEKMTHQLAKAIATPEFTQVDCVKESYSVNTNGISQGNTIYRMKIHIVPI